MYFPTHLTSRERFARGFAKPLRPSYITPTIPMSSYPPLHMLLLLTITGDCHQEAFNFPFPLFIIVRINVLFFLIHSLQIY